MKEGVVDRLEMNAYLTRLIEGWDISAARAVVQAFCRLPMASNERYTTIETKTGTSIKGHTNELGDVNISDREVKETTTGENEGEVERVGYFKVRRHGWKENSFRMIIFEHYWEADRDTKNSEKAPNAFYGVEYLTETLEPYALIMWELEEESYGASRKLVDILERPSLLYKYLLTIFGHYSITNEKWYAYPFVLHGESQLQAAIQK